MTVLMLRLAGPMQAWGSGSRFVRRSTDARPTKSGVLGLVAAAQGRRRTDPLEDLVRLRFGVRVDQPGELLRDFQTARTLDGTRSMPLSYRFYLSDAVFLAGLEGDQALLEALRDALLRPTFPLYLGRRSCPPAGPMLVGLDEGPIEDALAAHPWLASAHHRRSLRSPAVELATYVDEPASPTAGAADDYADAPETVRDVPLSFDPNRRQYGWRQVRRSQVTLSNSDFVARDSSHDPMAALARG